MGKAAKVERAAEWVAPQALVAWPGNPRRNAKAIGEVAKSIQRFGFGAPIVARAENREVIAGHTRLAAALKLGLVKVPVRYLEISEKDAHRLALADNKTGEVAEWSGDLDALLAELGADLPGFEESLSFPDALLDPIEPQADPPIEEPEADAPFVSDPGRVYQLGRHVLTFDSSIGVVDADAQGLIFDPPFDADYAAWQTPPKAVVVVVWRRCDSAFGWIASRISEGFGTHELVFTGGVRGQHNHTLPACMHENVTVLRRKWWKDKFDALDRATLKASGAKVAKDGRHISWQEHSGGVVAAQSIGMSWAKPVMQMMIAMAYMPKGAVVFDPCAGSGSSLIAAERSGRTVHAYETQGAWVDLIRRRWTRECTERRADPGPDALV